MAGLRGTVKLVRKLGPRVIAGELRRRVASEDVNFGLRCDLGNLPPIKSAAIPLTLEACDDGFRGFDGELERATGADYGRTLRRRSLHEAGVKTLHAALDEQGRPVYVQWLVTPADQPLLERHAADSWPPLQPGEVLLEYAYTFTDFRGLGVMGDGMGQLLRVGAQRGARSALTYVLADNVPSLRGCAKVGFKLDHVKVTRLRLGTRRDHKRPPTEDERRAWEAATAPRPRG